ncbi:MAG: hypothetical protein GY936_15240 [Ignavibacteriae bacterium]|nr:hypothetical protein [Ignavibacteriota bacterium]
MVFLNPSILFGLIAASIPILIHILNFRKLKKVEFSTLAFLKELQKSKIKKIKIKQWLLLLIRTLLILFLVFAFARPTLESTSIVSTNSAAKSSTVFLLDDSFSMLAITDDGSNYNRSKLIIKNIISEMQNGDEFFFIINNDSIRRTLDSETAVKIIEESEISESTFNLTNSVNLAIELLKESQNINKQIFLFSDFQENVFNKNIDSINSVINLSDIKLYTFKIASDQNINTAISDLKLENSIIELNKPLYFKATIHNYSEVIQNNLTASLFINDKRVAQQSISLNTNEENIVRFETTLDKIGLMQVYAQIDEDDIVTDNKSFTSFFVPEKINVLLLFDNQSEIKFIDAALSTLSNSSRIEVTKKDSKYFSSVNENEFDLIILVGGSNLVDIEKLERSISEGNKLIFFPSESTSVEQLKILEHQLGFPKVQEIITTNISKNDYAQFGFIDLRHPLFSNLFSNEQKNDIDSPNFYKYIKIAAANNIKPIIKFSDNSVFLGEYNLGNGKVVFFNSAPNLSWNNFPVKSLFAPLTNRLITYLTSANSNPKSYLVNGRIPIHLNNLSHPQLKVNLPNGNEYINLEGSISNIFNYKRTRHSGNYEFYNKNKLVTFASVNVDPSESNIKTISDDELNNYFSKLFESNYILLNSKEDYITKIKETRFGSELWKLFLVVALLLALTEMLISRSTKKDLVNL